jgi:hypothetical protein
MSSAVSLSQEILFGTYARVKQLIEAGADVNEKDVYGFTPLIEATIKNDLEIAKLLLAHKARIDQVDVSGQTALQWAVNRYYLPFCELFLSAGANPNHYSKDGQPILVNPILREQKNLIDLLVSYGASTEFAHDYISAKLIGHRYELVGRADIINTKGMFIDLDFEGFYLEFTLGIILKNLIQFTESTVGQRYKAYDTVISKIRRALRTASLLIPYKYTVEGTKGKEDIIQKSLNQDLVVIPVSYEGHAITFVKYGRWFGKTDRGVRKIVDTVVISGVGNPYTLTPQFLSDLMYNNKSDEYINTEIKKILDLKPFATLPPRYQQSGNCSWANVEASVPAMMFMLMFRGNLESRAEIATLKKSIMSYYDTWVEWDKDRALDECIADFHEADRIRKASKAAILGAILLQRCRPTVPKEIERAKKILPILTLPDYNYILKSYIKVYGTRVAGEMGENFVQLLKMCGLNFSTLTLKNTKRS